MVLDGTMLTQSNIQHYIYVTLGSRTIFRDSGFEKKMFAKYRVGIQGPILVTLQCKCLSLRN